jgi:hypothetical protein
VIGFSKARDRIRVGLRVGVIYVSIHDSQSQRLFRLVRLAQINQEKKNNEQIIILSIYNKVIYNSSPCIKQTKRPVVDVYESLAQFAFKGKFSIRSQCHRRVV